MNTEITDTMHKGRTWVCYDAECALCVRWANRFRALLDNHGFTLLPLQSPDVKAALQMPEAELLAEMRVVAPGGLVFGGADALAYLSSEIFKPLFWLTRIPGAMPLLRRAYRYVARNRGCAGNACRAPRARVFRVGNPVDWLPLLMFTIAAVVIGRSWAPWLYMWALAFALFAGCKWLCFRKAVERGAEVSFGRKLGFLFAWVGMDAEGFFAEGSAIGVVAKANLRAIPRVLPPHPGPMTRSLPLARPSRASAFGRIPFAASQAAQVPWGEGGPLSHFRQIAYVLTQSNLLLGAEARTTRRAVEFIFAVLKIAFGAILLWGAARYALAIDPLLGGWTGMMGLIFMLHFGLFHLLSLAWRTAGVDARPLMRAPILAKSVGEFWGERWNTAFNRLAARFLFRPLHRAVGARAATMFVFLASGLVHEVVISVPARGGYGLPTLYFLLQGMGVLFEHTRLARRAGINGGFRGWLFTFVIIAGPAFWLFHPPFIHNVILPFLKWLGAT